MEAKVMEVDSGDHAKSENQISGSPSVSNAPLKPPIAAVANATNVTGTNTTGTNTGMKGILDTLNNIFGGIVGNK
jgi:hypothetical protein